MQCHLFDIHEGLVLPSESNHRQGPMGRMLYVVSTSQRSFFSGLWLANSSVAFCHCSWSCCLLSIYLQARLLPVDRLVLGAMLICAPSPRNSTVDLNGLDNCPLETGVPQMRFLPLVVCRGLDLRQWHWLNYMSLSWHIRRLVDSRLREWLLHSDCSLCSSTSRWPLSYRTPREKPVPHVIHGPIEVLLI